LNTDETRIKKKEAIANIAYLIRVQSVFHPWLLKIFAPNKEIDR